MGPELVIDIGKHALEVTLVLMTLLLMPALVVGLIISVFQAATQINELTLSFIPKLLVTALVLVLGGPYLLRVMMDYTTRLFETIPALVQ